MKKLLLISLSFGFVNTQAQDYWLVIPEPIQFSVEAGKDLTIEYGDTVNLGKDIRTAGGAGEYSYSWSSDDVTFPSANLIVSPRQTKIFILKVVDKNGCTASDTVKISVKSLTSSSMSKFRGRVNLYPNPSVDQITLDLEGFKEQVSLEIVNFSGLLVQKESFEPIMTRRTTQYQLPSSGVYFLKLTSGSMVEILKFIVN